MHIQAQHTHVGIDIIIKVGGLHVLCAMEILVQTQFMLQKMSHG